MAKKTSRCKDYYQRQFARTEANLARKGKTNKKKEENQILVLFFLFPISTKKCNLFIYR